MDRTVCPKRTFDRPSARAVERVVIQFDRFARWRRFSNGAAAASEAQGQTQRGNASTHGSAPP